MKTFSKILFGFGTLFMAFGIITGVLGGLGGIGAINAFIQWSIAMFAGSVASSLIAARD